MNPEKEIVNFWLNRNGFFTINDINAGQNKVIDIVAIRQKGEVLEKVQHIEISTSVSSSVLSEKEKEDLKNRFTDPAVQKALRNTLHSFLGKDYEYENVLVTTAKTTPFDNVRVVGFEDVLFTVVRDMDKQNYRDEAKRVIQLIKYLLIANPDSLAKLVAEEQEHRAFTHSARERLVMALLSDEGSRKAFSKTRNEKFLIELLKISSLKQPERLAEAMTQILSKRSYNRFISVLFKQKEMQEFVKEELSKQQSSLESFLGKK